jgi:hypothetical protein
VRKTASDYGEETESGRRLQEQAAKMRGSSSGRNRNWNTIRSSKADDRD